MRRKSPLPSLPSGYSSRPFTVTHGHNGASAVLTIRQVSRFFREGDVVHRVLDGLDASVDRGEAVAILGRSGSGKSTLLNLISGIDHPDSGSIELDGQEITRLGEPARTLFRRSRVGFVYQFFNLIPTLDVEENVRLVLELNGMRGAEARRRSLAMLEQVGLSERAHSAVDKLSGGEGAALLLVTHDTRLATAVDRVLELRDGRLFDVTLGHPEAAARRSSGA
jgi:putative ABC transport system ATP-binding protein